MTETKRFIDAWQDTIAALRAELDALKAERDEARALVLNIVEQMHGDGEDDLYNADKDAWEVSVTWNASRPAPDTNRDAGDEREEQ